LVLVQAECSTFTFKVINYDSRAIAHLVVNLIQDKIRNEENEIDDERRVSYGSQKRSDNKI
jgi:putative lipoic acid-binding regulatory protein